MKRWVFSLFLKPSVLVRAGSKTVRKAVPELGGGSIREQSLTQHGLCVVIVGWCFKEKMIIGLVWSLVRTGDDGVITSARYRELDE